MILKYITIFILQFIYNYLRVYEIKHSYDNNTLKVIINDMLMNTTALITTYISISEMLKGDLIIAFVFISGAVFGKWFATQKSIKYGN
jgi:hypothetical protein